MPATDDPIVAHNDTVVLHGAVSAQSSDPGAGEVYVVVWRTHAWTDERRRYYATEKGAEACMARISAAAAEIELQLASGPVWHTETLN